MHEAPSYHDLVYRDDGGGGDGSEAEAGALGPPPGAERQSTTVSPLNHRPRSAMLRAALFSKRDSHDGTVDVVLRALQRPATAVVDF